MAPITECGVQTEESKRVSERKAKSTIALLWISLSSVAVVPFFFMGRSNSGGVLALKMPQTNDMNLHYEQMKSFHQGLSAGEIYPRWEEDTNRGFGAPTMNYYPPGIYYITSAFYSILGDWTRALLAVHLLTMLCSSAAIYVYARQWMSRFAASIVMAAYIFLPYRMVDLYVRGAIAELWGFVWMPLMLFFGERLFRRFRVDHQTENGSVAKRIQPGNQGHLPGWWALLNISGLATSFGAFIWMHPPTAYQFSLAFGLFLLVLSWRRRDLRGLVYAGAALALGLTLSAAYLYPAAIDQDLIRNEYVSETWPYHSSYVLMHNLFNIGSQNSVSTLTDSIWVFGSIMILICTITLMAKPSVSKPASPRLREQVVLWTVVAGFASLMMTALSHPIGRFIPRIEIGIFAWRMLTIAGLGVALLSGACFEAVLNTGTVRQKPRLLGDRSLAIVVASGGIVFGIFVIAARGFSARPSFVPSPAHVNFAAIPRSANEDVFALPIVERAELAEDNGSVSIDRWEPQHRSIRVELSRPDRLLLRTFDFPNWHATVDGKAAPIIRGEALRLKLNGDTRTLTVNGRERAVGMNKDFETLVRATGSHGDNTQANGEAIKIVGAEQLGDINLNLPEGVHQIELEFMNTATTRTGLLTTASASSIVALMVLGALILRSQTEGKSRQNKLNNG